MREKPETATLPPALQRVAFALRTFGGISFWLQLILGVVSLFVLVFATISGSVGRQVNPANNQGTGFGVFFAICGLVTLGVGAYFAFRYTRLAKNLIESNAAGRPSKADTLQIIRLGLIVNLVGMLLTIVGAQAIIGSILAKSFAQPQGAVGVGGIVDLNRFVQPIDLFVVQANTNTIAAHFVGITASLWLFNRVNR
ncbi:FIG00872441: hypothetical protein [uncultured Coleofasciculus sp.]|jgi:hypothetical protein|uniref:DUF3611 family protein n=1 Tax=uncultured Coleofasciculus sp. TaxID=1267456 RepID=A0A6J4KDU8_9CYAN|nr:FIG00872441: hypothetical protein [uncultured Coleofasciculus sp.]